MNQISGRKKQENISDNRIVLQENSKLELMDDLENMDIIKMKPGSKMIVNGNIMFNGKITSRLEMNNAELITKNGVISDLGTLKTRNSELKISNFIETYDAIIHNTNIECTILRFTEMINVMNKSKIEAPNGVGENQSQHLKIDSTSKIVSDSVSCSMITADNPKSSFNVGRFSLKTTWTKQDSNPFSDENKNENKEETSDSRNQDSNDENEFEWDNL